jgi:hypothetical protein
VADRDPAAAGPAPAVLRRDLHAVTERLIAEFAGTLAAGTVIRSVARGVRELQLAGVREGLSYAAEAMARQRLLRRLDQATSSLPVPPPRLPGVTAAPPEARWAGSLVDQDVPAARATPYGG